MLALLNEAILAIDEPLMIHRKLLLHELGHEGIGIRRIQISGIEDTHSSFTVVLSKLLRIFLYRKKKNIDLQ